MYSFVAKMLFMPIRSVAVFCGSKFGKDPVYKQHTSALGKLLAAHAVSVVYGGGSVGLMGLIADEMMENKGRVTGVIPQVLVDWERQHQSITELLVVPDMHVRKKKMYELCDAAVILPGGFGTLDELFEMLTWNQLAIHDKKIFILNSGGYYQHLIAHIEKMRNEEFLYEAAYDRLRVLEQPDELLPYLLEND